MPQICDMGQTALLPFRRHAEDVYAPKNPTASAGFEPAIFSTRGQHALMDITTGWLIDIVFLLYFLPDCGMHCRFSHTLSVTQYLFILSVVNLRSVVATSVYRARKSAVIDRQLLLCARVGWSLQCLGERR
jgi:hypothetical protein